MLITKSLKKCIKNISSDDEILFRYTEKIQPAKQWENLISTDRVFYISYANQTTYIAIGQSKEYVINKNNDLEKLKKLQYKMKPYGENKNEILKLFGGVSFNLDQKADNFWEDIPKGLFYIPKFLIIKNKKGSFISYYKFIKRNSNIEEISIEYGSFIKELNNVLDIQKTNIIFDKNIPDKKTYSEIFLNLSKSIKNKNIDKIVLSRMKKFSVNNKAIPKDTSCTNFYIDLKNNKRFLGTTPELLVEIKNNSLITSAIAGTLKKDLILNNLDDFLNDKKELSEHQYVVDDLIKKISYYCKKINKKDNPEILELKHFYHLYTPIQGKLKKNIHILDLTQNLHPTPAVSGTPQNKVLDMIIDNEPFDRGWYSGYIGWFDINGEGRFDVAIRSALQIEQNLYCYAGGGLVKDSKEAYEWNETELKFQHLLSAIK